MYQMEKDNELLQTSNFYFKRKLNFNFDKTFNIIILTLLGLTHLYIFKRTIMQKLGAQKLLIFYSLDYPTNVTPNLNNRKTL